MEEKENKKTKSREYATYFIIIAFIILIRSFVVTPVIVNGTSMYPTLHDNDIMILSKIYYTFNDIKRFDIVVVSRNNEKLIKRVIALPGEKVKIKNNELYINNKIVEQDFLPSDLEDIDFSEKEVSDDCYFVMGDNRRDSLDSRYFGCVNRKAILGVANLTLFPFKNFGIKH